MSCTCPSSPPWEWPWAWEWPCPDSAWKKGNTKQWSKKNYKGSHYYSVSDPYPDTIRSVDPGGQKWPTIIEKKQGFGSGSGFDPDSIRLVDPDPYLESGSGSRRAKMTHKSRQKFRNVRARIQPEKGGKHFSNTSPKAKWTTKDKTMK